MAKIEEIIKLLQTIAPLETQEKWDNSGWQIRLNKKEIKKIMLCVTVTNDVLLQAKENNCDMIISHHPMFLCIDDIKKSIVREMIIAHIPVYSIHTPFDKVKGGTTDSLMKACKMPNNRMLNDYSGISYTEIPLKELIERIKKSLNIKSLRVTNYSPDKIVRKIAFCAGSGTSFCEDVANENCDCFVTADLKYHTAQDFKETIIDVGHLESEKPALYTLKNALKCVECVIAKENSPIIVV